MEGIASIAGSEGVNNIVSYISEIIANPDVLFGSIGAGTNLIPMLLIFLVAGVLFCFFGYKLFKLLVALGGLGGGYYVGSLIVNLLLSMNLFELTQTMQWVILFVFAAIGAALAVKLLKLGVAVGVAWVLHTALLPVFAQPEVMDRIADLIGAEVPPDFAAWVVGALVGLLAVLLMRPIIILATAFGGGMIISQFGLTLLGVFGWLSPDILANGAVKIAVCAVFAVLGVIVQFRKKSKKQKSNG